MNHRDIESSNVLLTLHDGVALPEVIDFGNALATSVELTKETLFTPYAQILGTPESMAPERAEISGLDIDTCASVPSVELAQGRLAEAEVELREGLPGPRGARAAGAALHRTRLAGGRRTLEADAGEVVRRSLRGAQDFAPVESSGFDLRIRERMGPRPCG